MLNSLDSLNLDSEWRGTSPDIFDETSIPEKLETTKKTVDKNSKFAGLMLIGIAVLEKKYAVAIHTPQLGKKNKCGRGKSWDRAKTCANKISTSLSETLQRLKSVWDSNLPPSKTAWQDKSPHQQWWYDSASAIASVLETGISRILGLEIEDVTLAMVHYFVAAVKEFERIKVQVDNAYLKKICHAVKYLNR
ncbi:hypothetical protein HK100_010952, partial [Physocladia obscura]